MPVPCAEPPTVFISPLAAQEAMTQLGKPRESGRSFKGNLASCRSSNLFFLSSFRYGLWNWVSEAGDRTGGTQAFPHYYLLDCVLGHLCSLLLSSAVSFSCLPLLIPFQFCSHNPCGETGISEHQQITFRLEERESVTEL